MARYSAGFWSYRRGGVGEPPPPPPPPFVYVAPPVLPPAWYVITVGNRNGTVIGELTGALEMVSWGMDGYGTAALMLPSDAPAAYEPLLEPGNRVCIQFSNGLPAWGGVIDPPRETTPGQTRLQMYEAGYMLTWDWVEENTDFAGENARTAAAILAQLVTRSLLDVEMFVPADDDGAAVEVTFSGETLASASSKLRGLDEKFHWLSRALFAPGDRRIRFGLRAFRHRTEAEAPAGARLIQGHNFVSWSSLSQGPITNDVTAAGEPLDDGSAGEPARRYRSNATHAASEQRYGRRRTYVVLPDMSEEETPGRTAAYAAASVAAYHEPRWRVQGVCLDMEPGRLRGLDVGQRVAVEMFRPAPRVLCPMIIGMEYRPATGTLSLVFDDIDGLEVAGG